MPSAVEMAARTQHVATQNSIFSAPAILVTPGGKFID